MPRSKSGVTRPNIDYKQRIEAVTQILEGNLSIYKAARIYKIPETSLKRYVNRLKTKSNFRTSGPNSAPAPGSASSNQNEVEPVPETSHNEKELIPNYKTQQVFSSEQELLLLDYIKEAASLHYGMTLNGLAEITYQFARANNIKYPPNWDKNNKAGEGWIRSFRNKYKNDISLRKPEATSLARATAFNSYTVGLTFENYKKALDKCPMIKPHQIWNCDETGISTVHKPPKILAPVGIKQVGAMTSAERGVNVTMIAGINAGGGFIPPMLIFPRVHFKDFMLSAAPPGTIGGANPSGWSNEDLFIKFFDHFLEYAKPSVSSPCILLMDNHESHLSVEVIHRAKASGVVLVTFHPHTSHKFQPLDRTVFGPFKKYYDTAMNDFMKTPGNVGKPVTIYNIAQIVGKAYPLAFTPSNIIKGFNVTGFCPLNVEIFQDDEFAPSDVTDRPLPCPENPLNVDPNQDKVINTPSTSGIISPRVIKPFPKAEPRKNNKPGREKGRSRILTDTPEKLLIEEKKIGKELKKNKEKAILTKTKSIKRKVLCDSSDSDSIFSLKDSSEDFSGISDEEGEIPLSIYKPEGTLSMTPSKLKQDDCKVGDFVIFVYEGSYFPGKILDLCKEGVFISSMKKTYKNWTWPEKPDEMLYTWEDLVTKIKAPTKVHSRRELYRVAEMVQYWPE